MVSVITNPVAVAGAGAGAGAGRIIAFQL